MENISGEAAKRTALVVGADGGIGGALLSALLEQEQHARVFAVSRSAAPASAAAPAKLDWRQCDQTETGIADVVDAIRESGMPLHRVVICPGILHGDGLRPEKALEQLRRSSMREVLDINTVLPTLWLSALTPLLRDTPDAVVAVLSARIGSIGDNNLGGWYSYRASKAALNMVLKTAAIEFARRAPRVKLLAFHPGTTDTELSRPFQARVPADKLFEPDFVAQRLLAIMEEAEMDGELSFVDWAGKSIPW